MGLRVTHGCWEGAYHSFSLFRTELAKVFKIELDDMEGFGGFVSWGPYRKHPITILLDHSDCDGVISWKDTRKVADALKFIRLDPRTPRAILKRIRRAMILFERGLRRAYRAGEGVEFR